MVLIASGFASCKKEGHRRDGFNSPVPASNLVVNATIKSGDTYKLNLSAYGNGNPSITKQASSYVVSQIKLNTGGYNVYEYVSSLNPKAGGNTDQVVLKINALHESSGGCQNHYNDDSNSEKNITINFTVN